MNAAELHARIRELEAVCQDAYSAAVELGLPRSLIRRLWNIVGNTVESSAFGPDIEALAESDVQPIPEVPPLPVLPRTARRTVVVDDAPLMLKLITNILKRDHYEVLGARDGGEALEKAARHAGAIHLLVTDCEMPVLTGLELAQRMRGHYPGLKVLYQTGYRDMLFEARRRADVNSTVLEKPFTARTLLEAVRLSLFGTISPEST